MISASSFSPYLSPLPQRLCAHRDRHLFILLLV